MTDRPNILLLLTDQQRWDAVGANGGRVSTPNIDRLAAEGCRFTHAFTCNPLCSPARASILTGLYPHEHKLIVNTGDFNNLCPRLDASRATFLTVLSQAGYNVGYSGKWHVGSEEEAPPGVARWHPMREYYSYLKENGVDWTMWQADKETMTGPGATFVSTFEYDPKYHPSVWIADRAIDSLDAYASRSEPFCIAASWYGPHFPEVVPPPYDTMYDPESIPEPKNFGETFEGKPRIQRKELWRWNAEHLTWPMWQRIIATYWGFVTLIDDQIGRILSRLDELGAADNTLVIFMTDHGDNMGNHRLFNKGFTMYEETMRIPLILRWPQIEPKELVRDEFVSTVDVCPTILDAAGASMSCAMHGRSLLPLMRGEHPDGWPEEAFAQFHGYETTLYTQRMLRTRAHKYIYNPADIDELYDLRADPGEMRNLALDLGHAALIEEMRARLHARMAELRETCVETCGYHIGVNRRVTGDWEN